MTYITKSLLSIFMLIGASARRRKSINTFCQRNTIGAWQGGVEAVAILSNPDIKAMDDLVLVSGTRSHNLS
jgi:hypothetical protein